MAETVLLDPVAVASDREQIDLTPFIGKAGPDWGDAKVEAAKAEAERGELPLDPRQSNREVSIPLNLLDRAGLSFDEIREQVQAKASIFQQEGGYVSRETSVGTLYGEVVGATLKLGGGYAQAMGWSDVDSVLTLEVIPDLFGDEVELDLMYESTAPQVNGVLLEDGEPAIIRGNYPGRVRIETGEDEGQARLGLLYAFRSRLYDPAGSAKLVWGAEELTPLDTSVVGPLTSEAANGDVIIHQYAGDSWTPVLSTQADGGDHMTHRGSYRVKVRVQTQDTLSVPAQLRLAWGVGDLAAPQFNDPWEVPKDNGTGSGMWYIADLGVVHLAAPPVGDHRWQGVVQVKKGEGAGNTTTYVDQLWLVPLDECAGEVSAKFADYQPGVLGYATRDTFNQSAGTLSGKTADVGGNWSGSGDADQFVVDSSAHDARRTAVSDTAGTGRRALLGSTQSDIAATVYVATTSDHDGLEQGLILRYVDANNWLRLSVRYAGVSDLAIIGLWKRVGGGTPEQVLASLDFVRYPALGIVLTAAVIDDKFLWAWQGAGAGNIFSGADPDLAPGEPLEAGNQGIYDENSAATAATRLYNNFATWVPTQDAVLFADQRAELRTEGIYRADEAGEGYARKVPEGDLPRIPVSGLDNRPVELLLKASRGDFDQLPDVGIDATSAQVFYRPSWLTVPGA